jgi:hypothetical protein
MNRCDLRIVPNRKKCWDIIHLGRHDSIAIKKLLGVAGSFALQPHCSVHQRN